MDFSRVKTILIYILLAVNLFLVGNIWLRQHAITVGQNEDQQMLLSFLENTGLKVDKAVLVDGSSPVFEVPRSVETENRIFTRLFGEVVQQSEGSVYTYTGREGYAIVRTRGDFEIHFNEPIPLNENDEALNSILQSLEILETSEFTLVPNPEQADEDILLTAKAQNLNVWGCHAYFDKENDLLLSVTGRWPFGEALSVESKQCRNSQSALISLADFMKKRGFSGTLLSMELGLSLEQGAPSTNRLVPFWKFELTDGLIFYVNAIDGNVVREFK